MATTSACLARAFQRNHSQSQSMAFPKLYSTKIPDDEKDYPRPIDKVNVWINVFSTIVVKFSARVQQHIATRATGIKSETAFLPCWQ